MLLSSQAFPSEPARRMIFLMSSVRASLQAVTVSMNVPDDLSSMLLHNVLHIYNSKLLPIKLLVNTMKELGINIEAVDDETMSRKLKEILMITLKKKFYLV